LLFHELAIVCCGANQRTNKHFITPPKSLQSTVPSALLMQCNAGSNKSWNVPHKNSAGLMIRLGAMMYQSLDV